MGLVTIVLWCYFQDTAQLFWKWDRQDKPQWIYINFNSLEKRIWRNLCLNYSSTLDNVLMR